MRLPKGLSRSVCTGHQRLLLPEHARLRLLLGCTERLLTEGEAPRAGRSEAQRRRAATCSITSLSMQSLAAGAV